MTISKKAVDKLSHTFIVSDYGEYYTDLNPAYVESINSFASILVSQVSPFIEEELLNKLLAMITIHRTSTNQSDEYWRGVDDGLKTVEELCRNMLGAIKQ